MERLNSDVRHIIKRAPIQHSRYTVERPVIAMKFCVHAHAASAVAGIFHFFDGLPLYIDRAATEADF